MRIIRQIGDWIEDRVKLRDSLQSVTGHRVPRTSASWFYVFGSALMTCLMVQLITGVCLALVYVPSADSAWESLFHLTYQQPLGWFLRAMHAWGSNFMLGILIIHVVQVFLFGAFKFPRELTWMIGVLLLLCTFGMAFTGQVLRWDQDAYWGLGIGASMTGRLPFVGPELVHVLLGGPIIGGETLTRFFALHVFVVPGMLIGLVVVHLFLVLRLGVNEYPMPGRLVKRDTYREDYEDQVEKDGVPFFPDAAKKDMVFSGLVLLSIFSCAIFFGPVIPGGQPDPSLIDTEPRPDFFFLWIFSALALLPPQAETILILTVPPLLILWLIVMPLFFGTGEKHWSKRPVSVVAVLMVLVTVGVLTGLGETSPWSPKMDAWSGDPTPPEYVRGRTPLQLQGALVLQQKQCRNCHQLGGLGGERGPALDDVATRLTKNQLIRQVLQGGGNMPAYGKHLAPTEVSALISFLETMHPRWEPAARNPEDPEVPPPEGDGD